MADPAGSVIAPTINDPVTKAVVDNIMGNLPTKKPHVRCEDCDISFTSQTVLDAHLQGARHAKQIRSKTIMATLEETKVAFTKDEETNGLKCNVCNVCLNSIQQLQTHLNGNRHKKKAMKGGWIGKDVVQLGTATTTTTTMARTPSSTGNLDLATSTTGFAYSCDICNKFFNSQAQYDVHVASRKHIDKANGTAAAKNQRKKRFFPYWKRTKMDNSKMSHIQSLANNFVTGGYVNYM